MISYTVEVYSKCRKNDDCDYLQCDRYNFEDVLIFLEMLRYYPFEIREVKLKQYACNYSNAVRVVLLNCFNVIWPCNNMIFEPKFEIIDVSKIL